MTQIKYKPRVFKQLKKIPKSGQRKILRKIEVLAEDPHAGKTLQGELRGFFSIRAWPYRIIYQIEGKRIIVVSVAHRKEVYRY